MKKCKKQARKNRIVFSAAVIILGCFLLGSLLFLQNIRRINDQKGINYLIEETSRCQSILNHQTEGHLQVLRGVAVSMSEIDLENRESLLTLLNRVNHSNGFIHMGLAGTDGRVDFVDADGTVHTGIDLSRMTFFKAALKGGEGVSETLPSPVTGDYVNCYATPVYQNGKLAGILCAVNDDAVLWDILNVPVYKNQGFYLVADSEGIIVSPLDARKGIRYATHITQVLSLNGHEEASMMENLSTGKMDSYTAEWAGQSVLIVNRPLARNGWQLLGIVSRDYISARYNYVAIGIAIIILSASLFFVLLLLWQKQTMNRSRSALEKLAYRDELTGVSNQARFLLDGARLLQENSGKRYAVWSFDIRKFTSVNDLFGFAVGDRMLQWIATMFEQLSGEDAAFCHISADLFTGMRPYRNRQDLYDWVFLAWEHLSRQEIVPADKMYIESVFGFYCPEDYDTEMPDMVEMINCASLARKKAKQAAGNSIWFFTAEMSEVLRWETELAAAGREALLHGNITFFLQPKVDIQNGYQISGAEALARWEHPLYGRMSPAEFIPIFENHGLIVNLDRYIFEQTCRWYAGNHTRELPNFTLAINVSRQGLLRADFLEYYTGVKQRYAIADGILELEFTESVFLDDYKLFQNVIVKLQEQGFMCSIDDFGSGYSSLNVLKSLTVDTLKLDGLFFQGGIDTERKRIVISHLIQMAQQLKISTVAEGVESAQQVSFLQHAGGHVVQGYFFSEPLPPSDFEELVAHTGGRFQPFLAD